MEKSAWERPLVRASGCHSLWNVISQRIGNDIDVDISAKSEESIDHSVKRNDPIKNTKPSSKDPEYFSD